MILLFPIYDYASLQNIIGEVGGTLGLPFFVLQYIINVAKYLIHQLY